MSCFIPLCFTCIALGTFIKVVENIFVMDSCDGMCFSGLLMVALVHNINDMDKSSNPNTPAIKVKQAPSKLTYVFLKWYRAPVLCHPYICLVTTIEAKLWSGFEMEAIVLCGAVDLGVCVCLCGVMSPVVISQWWQFHALRAAVSHPLRGLLHALSFIVCVGLHSNSHIAVILQSRTFSSNGTTSFFHPIWR